MEVLILAEELLSAVRKKHSTQKWVQLIANYDQTTLLAEISTDDKRKAFWINLYNAYYQILYLEHKIQSKKIFTAKKIVVAKKIFCLDDIEHGILRKSQFKYGLGYIKLNMV